MRGKKRVIKVGNVPVKSREQIEGIRESGKINTMVLDFVEEHIKAGISTQEIDDWVRKVTADNGAICAPYHYEGFPKSVCTSVNSVICHGIPSKDEILKEGDIINVDVSTIYKGYFSDASRMFCIGNVSADKKRLVKTAKEAIQVGLMEVKPFAPTLEIWGMRSICMQRARDIQLSRRSEAMALGWNFTRILLSAMCSSKRKRTCHGAWYGIYH